MRERQRQTDRHKDKQLNRDTLKEREKEREGGGGHREIGKDMQFQRLREREKCRNESDKYSFHTKFNPYQLHDCGCPGQMFTSQCVVQYT